MTSPPMTRAPARPGAALALLLAAALLAGLDFMIMNVALPAIKDDLGFTPEDLQWVISAYALALGGFLLLGGRLADLFGPRRLFVGGFAILTVASLVGGLVANGVVLILARAVQGFGAALLTPAALALIAYMFAEGAERNRAMGLFAAMQAVGATTGLIAGGLLVDGPGWQWVMLANVPLGLAALVLGPALLPERQDRDTTQGFDLVGAILVTASLVVLLYAVVTANQHGWASATTLLLFAAAAVGLALFVVVEHRVEHPLMPLDYLSRLDLAGSNLVAFLLTASAWSLFFMLTLHMQVVRGWSAIECGAAYIPMGVGIFLIARFVSPIAIGRVGARLTLGTALTLNAVALAWLGTQMVLQSNYWSNLLAPMVLLAIANGLANSTAIVAALQGVPGHEQGLASGLVVTALQVGGAFGVAILVSVSTAVTGDSTSLQSINDGYQHAIYTGAGLSVLGAAVAFALAAAGRRRGAATGGGAADSGAGLTTPAEASA
ncbi:MAG TPA: MFS transporter [Mycobacteriales bacterium]|nr:MFS transporter [Mycobacteriales bacterium]